MTYEFARSYSDESTCQHACSGFPGRGVLAFERSIDKYLVKHDPFALKRPQNKFVDRLKCVFGKAVGAEAILI